MIICLSYVVEMYSFCKIMLCQNKNSWINIHKKQHNNFEKKVINHLLEKDKLKNILFQFN